MQKQALKHDSHDTAFRAPFGAVRTGQTVTLAMGILDGFYVTRPRVRIRWEGGEQTLLLAADGRVLDGYHMVSAAFTPEKTGQYWLSFAAENGVGDTMRLCDSAAHLGGEGRVTYDGEDTPYLLTVYEKDFHVPEWFRDTVMYQIFPDRFYRSDRGHCEPKPRMHKDWNEDVSIMPAPGQTHYVADDFFGGNLAGIEEKLDYLYDLGARVLYLNPIFEAVSNHRYNTADYERIDPLLGTNEDFSALCRAANARGMRVILDGVFSHTGNISRYFNADGRFPDRGAAQGEDSPYFEWYSFTHFPDRYECWWGDRSLPNVREETPSYRQYILGENGIVRRWLAAGASGWRLDVADELPDLFLEELFAAATAEKSDAVVLGEVWENAAMKEAYGRLRPYLHGRQMHSVMNYPLHGVLLDFLLEKASARDAAAVIMSLAESYPEEIFHALMNMTGTHDVPRALSVLSGLNGDGVPREKLAELKTNGEQKKKGLARVRLLFAALFFLPGNVCIYYGDEAGMTGMRDPYCRRTFPWGSEDRELTEAVRRLARLRGEIAPLCGGSVRFLDGGDDVLAILREKDGACAVAAINRAGEERCVKLPQGAWCDACTGEEILGELAVPPASWRIAIEK